MPIEFRSPKYERESLTIPDEVSNLQKSFNGSVCSNKGDEYLIRNNIIDLLGENSREMSLAQRSNQWNLTATLYENIWRKRSLSIFSGENFPIKKEQTFLIDWLNPQSGKLYLDIGCSTALYGCLLKKAEPHCVMVSLDFSKPMLQEARIKAGAEQADQFLLRADARHLPCYGATFDGLVMGGTLNELSDPLKVLFEARRVIKKGGVFFMMHLIKANVWYVQLLQSSAEFGGLTFWTIDESNQLFKRAGFTVTDQVTKGIVCFSKLLAV